MSYSLRTIINIFHRIYSLRLLLIYYQDLNHIVNSVPNSLYRSFQLYHSLYSIPLYNCYK